MHLTEKDLLEELSKSPSKIPSKKALCKKYEATYGAIALLVKGLNSKGYTIIEEEDKYILDKSSDKPLETVIEQWNGEENISIGLVSDTHLGSKAQQLTHLNTMYDIFQKEGITKVYHAGDIADGEDVYKGHRYEVFIVGADKQKDYVVKHYPQRKGIITSFITGNHDLSYYLQNGFDIGVAIAKEREDLIYLGQYYANIKLTDNCILRLEHPMGKAAYALSYKIQRKIDNMRGGDKPNILAEGHYHFSNYVFRRNVHGFNLPSFQGPTNLSRRLGLECDNGGYILNLKVDKVTGQINDLGIHFYPFYELVENDY